MGNESESQALELARVEAKVLPEVENRALEVLAANIRAMQRFVERELEYGPDWGPEKGIDSDFLKEPGAEKICAAFNVYPRPVVLEKEIDDSRNLCSFTILCEAVSRDSGKVVATGMGIASTREAKWGKRWVWERELKRLGYAREGLRTREVHPKDKEPGKVRTEIQYQVANESWGDLVHTLEDMAYKRAKAECAQSLPGARTALRRLFDPDLKFAQFWRDMSNAGANGDVVHQILGVESVKDWVASGRNLEEAKRMVMEEMRRRKGASAAGTARAERPASRPQEGEGQVAHITNEQSTRLAALMKEGNWPTDAMRAFVKARTGADKGAGLSEEQARAFIAWLEALNHLVEVADREYGTDAPGVLQVLGIDGFEGIEAPVRALEDFRKRMAGEDSGLPWE